MPRSPRPISRVVELLLLAANNVHCGIYETAILAGLYDAFDRAVDFRNRAWPASMRTLFWSDFTAATRVAILTDAAILADAEGT